MGGGVAGEAGAREAYNGETAPGVQVFDKAQDDVPFFDGFDSEACQREVPDGFGRVAPAGTLGGGDAVCIREKW